ncbi:hypothetical protein [Jutongia sp.]|uniref:hypothetical protein n=1 Tax=Jutongia sp. TaxID=2944204 RepID=UPI0030795743
MKIEQYDSVYLKDGRQATIVEKLHETHFIADVGSSREDWETIDISIGDISERKG